jgi:hypothetical protein
MRQFVAASITFSCLVQFVTGMMDWLLGRCASERFINDMIIDVNGSTTSLGLLFTGDDMLLLPFRA